MIAPVLAGACDAHAHVFGEPAALASSGPVPAGNRRDYLAMLARIRFSRGVLVQSTKYGLD